MHLHLDCFAGLAGDMLLGALIDLGASPRSLISELSKLGLDGWSISFPKRPAGHCMIGQGIQVQMDHSHKAHDHATTNDHSRAEYVTSESSHDHSDRTFAQISQIILGAAYPERVEQRALAVFQCLAKAEARVHGCEPTQVHFHEVGAIDSIVDIVGVSLALEELNVDTISASPIPLGRGFITARHGSLPLPAPATMECLRGIPCFDSGLDVELVTPTGAAFLSTLVERFQRFPSMTITDLGYGAGTRKLPDRPNLVRAIIGHLSPEEFADRDSVWELRANIDDQSGEDLAHAVEAVRQAGTLDAWLVPILMKKGRPGYCLCALATSTERDHIAQTMLRHSTSLGVRMVQSSRTVLKRKLIRVETRYGSIAVKVALGLEDAPWNLAPEDQDCAQAAHSHKVPVKTVRLAAMSAALQALEQS